MFVDVDVFIDTVVSSKDCEVNIGFRNDLELSKKKKYQGKAECWTI